MTTVVETYKPIGECAEEITKQLMDEINEHLSMMYISDKGIKSERYTTDLTRNTSDFGIRNYIRVAAHNTSFIALFIEQEVDNCVLDNYGLKIIMQVTSKHYSNPNIRRMFTDRPIEVFTKLCKLNQVKYKIDEWSSSDDMTVHFYIPCISEEMKDHTLQQVLLIIDEYLCTLNERAILDQRNRETKVSEIDNKFLQRAMTYQPTLNIKKKLTIPYVIGMLQDVGELGTDKLQEIVDIINE